MLSIRLKPKLEQRLSALSEETGRPKSFYVREALERHLEELEDQYIALQRLENPGRRIALEDVENELDLEG